VHVKIEGESSQTHRYGIITPSGKLQIFSLKIAKNPIGLEANELFIQILSSMTVRDDLKTSKDWITDQLKRVKVTQIRSIKNDRERLKQWIHTQNTLVSASTVDPSSPLPLFHLGGITHAVLLSLLKQKKPLFTHQESWILSFKPMLQASVRYLRDFNAKSPEATNLEALYQDILILEKKQKR
jgi:hypothetical protein